ncbi:hypothetical protein B0H14DRAFT_3637985 [Mycena olivaceomarginata]|nr:hypothetical protein B0H14DRAFT_3637985 [Mycena olivaceomarginata]
MPNIRDHIMINCQASAATFQSTQLDTDSVNKAKKHDPPARGVDTCRQGVDQPLVYRSSERMSRPPKAVVQATSPTQMFCWDGATWSDDSEDDNSMMVELKATGAEWDTMSGSTMDVDAGVAAEDEPERAASEHEERSAMEVDVAGPSDDLKPAAPVDKSEPKKPKKQSTLLGFFIGKGKGRSVDVQPKEPAASGGKRRRGGSDASGESAASSVPTKKKPKKETTLPNVGVSRSATWARTATHLDKDCPVKYRGAGMSTLSLDSFKSGKSKPGGSKAQRVDPLRDVACPGITEDDHPRVPGYLKRTGAMGGGSRSVFKIAMEKFRKAFRALGN